VAHSQLHRASKAPAQRWCGASGRNSRGNQSARSKHGRHNCGAIFRNDRTQPKREAKLQFADDPSRSRTCFVSGHLQSLADGKASCIPQLDGDPEKCRAGFAPGNREGGSGIVLQAQTERDDDSMKRLLRWSADPKVANRKGPPANVRSESSIHIERRSYHASAGSDGEAGQDHLPRRLANFGRWLMPTVASMSLARRCVK
jgi:hypothetical protein